MVTKAEIQALLPKGFKTIVSKNGLSVWITHKLDNDFDAANKIVRKVAKKLKLEEIGAGTEISTMTRDWEFISLETEAELCKEAKEALGSIQKFFKKWGNSYCSSPKTYSFIDKMRALVGTDEN